MSKIKYLYGIEPPKRADHSPGGFCIPFSALIKRESP